MSSANGLRMPAAACSLSLIHISPAGFVERVGNRDALDRKIVDHAWIMDEGTERVHGAGIVGSPACHLEGAIHPVAGTRVPCDFDGDSHDVP